MHANKYIYYLPLKFSYKIRRFSYFSKNASMINTYLMHYTEIWSQNAKKKPYNVFDSRNALTVSNRRGVHTWHDESNVVSFSNIAAVPAVRCCGYPDSGQLRSRNKRAVVFESRERSASALNAAVIPTGAAAVLNFFPCRLAR